MSKVAINEEVVTRKGLGFWIYLMTDCVLFASLFATYAVLHTGTAGGPTSQQLFDLPFVLAETLILLTSSFTIGLAVLAAGRGKRIETFVWLIPTFALGVAFLVLELTEFHHFVEMGDSWQRSGFLSAFFTLVGTHGLHITVGLIWMAIMAVRLWRFKLKQTDVQRLVLLGLFWHFLDIIWIFIFTVVYLMGSMS
jgi:cytochrome o ubiquinol oxidase subunit 3